MARKSGQLRAKETLLLVVEGQTEQIYFNQMRSSLRMSNISIEPKLSPKNDPLNIIKTAINEKRKGDYQYIWCIFDLDTIGNEKYIEAITKAKKNNIFIADSLPCFEIWFLLHYRFSTKSYNSSDEVIRDLCSYINDYCKQQSWLKKKEIFSLLEEYRVTAIKNTKKLEKYNSENNVQNSTRCSIYKIFEVIDQIKGK